MRSIVPAVFGTALVFAIGTAPASAGGGGGGGAVCSGYTEGAEIVMRDSCFEGTAHFAQDGDTLEVRNEGTIQHTVTAADGSFDSGIIRPGERVTLAVSGTGTVRYYCTLHGNAEGEGMAGVLVVGDGGAPSVDVTKPEGEGPARGGEVVVAGGAQPVVESSSGSGWIIAGAVVLGTLGMTLTVARAVRTRRSL